ncbi:uncharacterized protein EDB93DRAFT_1101002 [Suillus bovinus]|uniref:uncharacterized protein n=1 Tax=Suillus bovinus TaxID=48563 RepID=UPI001B885C16|nr:uncharacterized protein EDB93DRAFT_1101002 [Suillus bovinus]KAG2157660.1 hypothetical protein EDB93DRAFT_1101002 [Suillus bovinus]
MSAGCAVPLEEVDHKQRTKDANLEREILKGKPRRTAVPTRMILEIACPLVSLETLNLSLQSNYDSSSEAASMFGPVLRRTPRTPYSCSEADVELVRKGTNGCESGSSLSRICGNDVPDGNGSWSIGVIDPAYVGHCLVHSDSTSSKSRRYSAGKATSLSGSPKVACFKRICYRDFSTTSSSEDCKVNDFNELHGICCYDKVFEETIMSWFNGMRGVAQEGYSPQQKAVVSEVFLT